MQLKVKQILKEKGMRMTELAAKLGVDQSNLSKSLEGNPTLSRLEEIADAVGVPIRELLPDEPPMNPTGILTMGKRRYALVPLSDEEPSVPVMPLEAPILTKDTLRDTIIIMARQCAMDGKTRVLFGVLFGRPLAVLYDSKYDRFQWLLCQDDGEVAHADYPTFIYDYETDTKEVWGAVRLAEFLVNDILHSMDHDNN